MLKVILKECLDPFVGCIFNNHQSAVWLLHGLVPCETADDVGQVLCTPFNHAPVYGVTSFNATQVGIPVLTSEAPTNSVA